MNRILAIALMLVGIIWVGCKKDDPQTYCWECSVKYPDSSSVMTQIFCDRTEEDILDFYNYPWTDPVGNELEFLGCVKQ
jgi:hypothetical protein